MKVTFVDGVTIVTIRKSKRISKTGYVGIYKLPYQSYQVCKGTKIIGWRPTLEQAVALRAEADRRAADGTFDDWYNNIVVSRKHK